MEEVDPEDEAKDRKPIIIGNKPTQFYLWTIIIEFQTHHNAMLWSTDGHLPTVEMLLRLLSKLGIYEPEDSRKKIKAQNTRCKYFDPKTKKCTNKDCDYDLCTWQIKKVCKLYEQNEDDTFITNQIIFEKVGALRE